MAKPNSRQTFSDYCLRSLGAPVIEINVDEDQIDDRIDEALQFYQFYHADSIEKFYLKHKVTNSTLTLTASVAGNFQVGETITGGTSGAKAVIKTAAATKITYNQLDDTNVAFAANETITGDTTSATATISSISKGDIENGYIALNDAITDVVRVMPIRDSVSSTDMFDIRYQIHLNDIHSVGFMGNLTEYVMSRQFLSLLDVVVDLRKKSKTYGKYFSIRISQNSNFSIYIPENFAHGFLCLSKECAVYYKCTKYRDKNSETTIKWNDKKLNIKWPIKRPILSEKDKQGIKFDDF